MDSRGHTVNRRLWLTGAAVATAALAMACGGQGSSVVSDAQIATDPEPTATSSDPTITPTPDLSDYRRPMTSGEELMAARLAYHTERDGDRGPLATDFTIRSINLEELLRGGPGKDGIPAVDSPHFVTQTDADQWLSPDEPVIALEVNGEARAYPIQILIWHEIANDELGGVPVAVTFCPLCNTAITFERRIDGEETTFGVSGLLRRNDLVMYDRTNESLWQQITGEAIVGSDTGKRLNFLASQIVAWQDFKQTFPDALVLSRETGNPRDYGNNPYRGYDRVGSGTIFPMDEFDDGRLDGKERVVAVAIDGDTVAFPFSELSEFTVLEAEVAGRLVVAFWQPGTLSPFDESFIIGGSNIGAAAAFSPIVDDERLAFEGRDGEIVDTKTGSVWNVLGRAVSGPMQGTELEPVLHANHFWFAWSVFRPETRVIRGSAAD